MTRCQREQGSRAHSGPFGRTIRRLGVALLFSAGLVAGTTAHSVAGARTLKPKIAGLTLSPKLITSSDGTVIVTATVTNATSCTLSSNQPVVGLPKTFACSGPVQQSATLPKNQGMTAVRYKLELVASGNGHAKAKRKTVKVLPGAGSSEAGVKQLVSDGGDFCALLTSGGVDCWGSDDSGDLGNGTVGTTSFTPVSVKGVGGTGLLSGVQGLYSGYGGYCALLSSDGLDCWGRGSEGELGDGSAPVQSDVPVRVVGVGGTGSFSGVASLLGSAYGYCALLTSGGVDCWGDFIGVTTNSVVPVRMVGVGGTGFLSGVEGLKSDGVGYCALLTSGGVDCWGYGGGGELGNGSTTNSNVPVSVEGVGGSGTLSGATALGAPGAGYCVLLTSGGVDCWGQGNLGELGDGSFSTTSDVPVQVRGVGGTGLLSGVKSLTDYGTEGVICVVLNSGGVDCWGNNPEGELGNGSTTNSDVPVSVEGVGGSGTLSGAMEVTSEYSFLNGVAASSNCALLTSGGLDCWGNGENGQLGYGLFAGSGVPVNVKGIGGAGNLSHVASVTSNSEETICALLTSGEVNCWGRNGGALGALSATPVALVGLP